MKLRYFIANLILAVVCSGYLSSSQAQTLQRMEITQVSAPAQGVAVFMDYPDKAAIIIESPITTLRFSSNMNGIVEEIHEAERGRYVLIIEPFTQILVIDSPGYIQQRQRIGNPQPRDVLYFDVIPEERVSDLISVIFNVEPADARLFVNGQETPINQTTQLVPGSVEVRLEREGYRAVTDAITVNSSNILFTYNLEQVQQQLVRITTQPVQSEVFVDNVREGSTDLQRAFEMFRFPGTYQLRINADGYLPVQTVIEVTENESNEFSYSLDRNVGTLRLELFPSNATVFVNQRERVLTDGEIELPPGLHSLEVSRPFHDSFSETIRIERGETETRVITLAPHKGGLQLVVSPSNAQVKLIDSAGMEVESWSGSQRRTDLIVGSYQLEISASGYETKTEQLRITRDEITNLRVELSQDNQQVIPTPRTQPVQQDITTNEHRLSLLISGELLKLPSDSFERNYGSSYMSGVSIGVSRPFSDYLLVRFSVGGFTSKASQDNVINPSGNLWYYYSQPALGIRRGILRGEALATMGLFRLKDEVAGEVRQQSFMYAGIGGGISFPAGLEVMLTYSLYSNPQQKTMMGIRLSWRLGG